MVADAGIEVLVLQPDLADRLPTADRLVVDLAAVATADGDPGHSAPVPSAGALADHPAYVIYTSGSTGTPKGVSSHTAHSAISSSPSKISTRSASRIDSCSICRSVSTFRSSRSCGPYRPAPDSSSTADTPTG